MEQQRPTIKHKGYQPLFKNKVLDSLTRTHVAVPITLFFLYSGGLVYWAIDRLAISVPFVILLFLGGLLCFTLIEYLMHRFVFHIVENAQWKKKLAYTMHGVHHEYPKDKMRLAMPPPLSLVIGTLFLGIFYAIFGIWGFGITAGFLVGYAAYLFVHYMVHAVKPPKNMFKTLWVHHSIHHFKDQTVAFGVTSPLWDVIFRTMPK